MCFQKITGRPPLHGATVQKTEITAWIIRVWEPHAPVGLEPLEWLLLSTVPILSISDAWEAVKWYSWRWILEDFHKALKTGCRMEKHFLQTVEAQWNLLAIMTPIALRLLEIRQVGQQAGETPATDVVSQDVVQVVTLLQKRPREIVTANHLWHAIAPGRLPRPKMRWSSGMADLMEGVDAGDGCPTRRLSCASNFFSLSCV